MTISASKCISEYRDEYGYIWSYTHTLDEPTDTLLAATAIAANIAADLAVKEGKNLCCRRDYGTIGHGIYPAIRPPDDRATCAERHEPTATRWPAHPRPEAAEALISCRSDCGGASPRLQESAVGLAEPPLALNEIWRA